MLVIICTKYGKNPSRTVDTTERTRLSRSRPIDLENISQAQRLLHATQPLILVIICAKYGKNPSRTVDFFSRSRWKFFKNVPKIQISKYKKNPSRTVDATKWTWYSKSRPNDLENIVKVKGHCAQHTLLWQWSFVPNMERIHPEL